MDITEEEYVTINDNIIDENKQLTSDEIKILFKDVFKHNHWYTKNIYKLGGEILLKTHKNKNFSEILESINDMANKYKGIGPLSIYDIANSIARYYNLKCKEIYIIADSNSKKKGPYNAIIKLNLKQKMRFKRKIGRINGQQLKLYTIDFDEFNNIDNKFKSKQFNKIYKYIRELDGDRCETFLCKWFKRNKLNEYVS